ncbi:uncharacterized protein LOC110854800 [Folsomia candida]|uniref:Myosin-6 n=1 Tax=Folsomia candida TaxID=158441 RepID=A0A226DXT6_FOLCA|nr:uncharacterized protein LOC110854800 [Folsomia candida]OXA49491.1 Myosin-6 [Folsomia candida]
MNRAMARIYEGLGAMKLSTIRLHELNSVSDFNPPDPNDDVQKQIDELKQDIIDLEAEISGMDPTSDLDQLRAAMALMQEEIAALNTALDNAAKQATDELQPEIDQLIASLDTVAANVFSLKLAVADVESALEQSQIVNIVAQILSGPDAGTVFLYEHGVFKRGNASTVMSTIVTLGYPEILKNVNYFINFLSFFSQMDVEQHKLWGYQALYYTVVANGQLYKAPHPFILAHKITKLIGTTPIGDVVIQAKSFLTDVVHPVISRVVFQSTQPPMCVSGLAISQLDCANGVLNSTMGFSFAYNFEGVDSRSVQVGWALAPFVDMIGAAYASMAYLLRRGNTLISKMGLGSEPMIDWNDPNAILQFFTSKCEVHDNCEQSLPTDKNVNYLVFGGNLVCQSPIPSVHKSRDRF